MSSMSCNSSVNSLMGFSVHQPAIGAPLQFFPAMGSKQLDEMIDAYIPGDVSILDKRAAVSMEFFEYTMATGDLFKFFMVYPTLDYMRTSPTMAAGYSSGFTTSPVMSESQWENSSYMTSPSSSTKATPANDFSNLPGMKIMTKDGRDVTTSASRGCKTKEQRDHAHLMRIIKACDSCRRKKTKCDPSHKRPSGGASSAKVTKKTKSTRPAAAPPQTTSKQAPITPESDHFYAESSLSLESAFIDSLSAPADSLSMEWEQFIQYEEEPAATIPYDYDFLLDPAGYFSPSMTESFSSSSTSPSQLPITPVDRDVHLTDGTAEGHNHKPILPYLDDGGVESGDGYLDFNLFSPGSSILDEEIGLTTELAASPIQSQRDHFRDFHLETHGEYVSNGTVAAFSTNAASDSLSSAAGDGLRTEAFSPRHHSPRHTVAANASNQEAVQAMLQGWSSDQFLARSDSAVHSLPTGLPTAQHVLEGTTSEGLYGREAIPPEQPLAAQTMTQLSDILNGRLATRANLQNVQHREDASLPRVTSSTTMLSVIPSGSSSALRRVTTISSSQGAERIIAASENAQQSTYSTTKAPNTLYRVPRPPLTLPVPLPVTTVGAAARGSVADALTRSLSSATDNKTVAKLRTGRVDKHSGLQHNSAASAALSNVESAVDNRSAGYDGGLFTVARKVHLSERPYSSESSVSGFCCALAVISASVTSTTTSTWNSLAGYVNKTIDDNLTKYTMALLLFSAVSFVPFLAMSALSVVAAWIQLRQRTSTIPIHGVQAHQRDTTLSSNSKTSIAKQITINDNNKKNLTAPDKLQHRLGQRNLIMKLRCWARNETWASRWTGPSERNQNRRPQKIRSTAMVPLF